jgi:hypothetical protein
MVEESGNMEGGVRKWWGEKVGGRRKGGDRQRLDGREAIGNGERRPNWSIAIGFSISGET